MIEYNEEYLLPLIFKTRGSVAGKSSVWGLFAVLVTFAFKFIDELIPGFREDIGINDINKSQIWSAATGVLFVLLGVRTNRALSRFWEGTGLLHQMRGEWFDSVSCCITFSSLSLAKMPKEVREFRHTIVRLMSLCHASALEEIQGGVDEGGALTTIDPTGLSDHTMAHLKNMKDDYHFNRVEMVLHLTQTLIVKNLDTGVIKIPPPILSRVFQTLSRGFVNLLNAKKIADTKFPFPYAQLIAIMLMMQTCLVPLMISAIIESTVWSCFFSFFTIFGQFALAYIAVELENPFGDDDNDLPLRHFQHEMNQCLLMLLTPGADLIPSTSEHRCILDFEELVDKVSLAEAGSETIRKSQRISMFVGGLGDDGAGKTINGDIGSPQGSPRKLESPKGTPGTATSSAPLLAPPPPAAPASTPAAAATAANGQLENVLKRLADAIDQGSISGATLNGGVNPSKSGEPVADLFARIDANLTNISKEFSQLLAVGAEIAATTLNVPSAVGISPGSALLLQLQKAQVQDAGIGYSALGTLSRVPNGTMTSPQLLPPLSQSSLGICCDARRQPPTSRMTAQ